MEIHQSKQRIYYFSWADQEILEDLVISCDEDTWLYRVETNLVLDYKHIERHSSTLQDLQTHKMGGNVDTRTYTRRKSCALRPSLEPVIESPFSNRSSLGLLNASNLNAPHEFILTPKVLTNQEKISLNSTDSERKPTVRMFKLDSPFTNSGVFTTNLPTVISPFDEPRLNTYSSDFSVPSSLENCSLFERNNCQMTESLVNFLAKQDLSKFPEEKSEPHLNNIHHGSPVLPESLDNLLDAVNCRPPSGFRDNEMTESVVNVDKVESLPDFEMTRSVQSYLDNSKCESQTQLAESTSSSETENIPPCNNKYLKNTTSDQNDKERVTIKAEGDKMESKVLNSTNDLENKRQSFKNKDRTFDLGTEIDQKSNITITNNINMMRKNNTSINADFNSIKSINITFVKERSELKEMRAPNCEGMNLHKSSVVPLMSPSRHARLSRNNTHSLNSVGGELEDDSSASDSSFSSCSTKPTSVEELRFIAQQQETCLAEHTTSTPTGQKSATSMYDEMDIELSPISSGMSRNVACSSARTTRSTNCSPARELGPSQLPGPRLRPSSSVPLTPPAGQVSHIARHMGSKLKTPKAVSKLIQPGTALQGPSGVPRPQVSRLPMPRSRVSGIPGPKHGHL